MSVIFYSAQELGNLAAVAIECHRDAGPILECVASLSAANAAAYNATYSDGPQEPIALKDIKAEYHRRADQPNFQEAIRTITGLDYNMVANSGTDFADAAIKSNQIAILNCVLRHLGDCLPD